MMGNPNSADLNQYLENLQTLGLQNSNLNDTLADALSDCRETCSTKVQKIFDADFNSLMEEPVETLPLNVVANVNPVIEHNQAEEHNAQLQHINAEIDELQAKRANIEGQRHRFIELLTQNVLNS